ncbi:phosphate ABC transporter, permease protein PstA [Achromobacter marplatensis]|uniref:Phosphate transport system permease protein PstA n=1 Tax=Achromobacter marplatensis TaxID=470868 RepID=A0ABX9G671_9BURK|nr:MULTISPECIES: phosphate ABC transporter permease PstA [Achromobacter]HCQ49156.1 phosphate ABC transporter permease PtsA [Achromobacter sp.]OWT61672.1 phosphate ABC transporter, permease protein PstA [Achromobacter marplatensis]QYJ20255.1 phosphate ABC transporter permease PstA [Achromobacter sp. ES-001]RBP17378.1 phosphate ABC transporter membrane protein 2 (PhoT family) [Achromobacter marplatensis]CAB3696783.1 Phosphate transport system permease protein PstA [Achromobacter marplatensis]
MTPQGLRLQRMRTARNLVSVALSMAATLFGLFWLIWILWTTATKGFAALKWDLIFKMTPPPGADGGLANALFGSLLMSVVAILLGTPIGIAAGTYLAEYVNRHRIGAVIRFVNDILLSAPSIVLGLFVYELVVRQTGHFSGWAGAIALAFIVLPVVVRTTDEMLQLVPSQMREAALALGVPQWKVTVQVLFRAALPGITTGVLLALARISGETAPLLFTALNNQYWNADLSAPMASVPAVIFQYAMSPYESWHALAWAGAFVVTMFVLLLSLLSRAILSRNKVNHD